MHDFISISAALFQWLLQPEGGGLKYSCYAMHSYNSFTEYVKIIGPVTLRRTQFEAVVCTQLLKRYKLTFLKVIRPNLSFFFFPLEFLLPSSLE